MFSIGPSWKSRNQIYSAHSTNAKGPYDSRTFHTMPPSSTFATNLLPTFAFLCWASVQYTAHQTILLGVASKIVVDFFPAPCKPQVIDSVTSSLCLSPSVRNHARWGDLLTLLETYPGLFVHMASYGIRAKPGQAVLKRGGFWPIFPVSLLVGICFY